MKKISALILICFTLSAKADYWTQKANYPGAGMSYPFSFSIGNKGYVGCGQDGSGNVTTDFWEYDPSANTWTQKADFGGVARWGGFSGFSIANKGYAGLGLGSSGNPTADFWEYDALTNVWTQKANFGGGVRIAAIGFSIAGMGYTGTGLFGGSGNDLWQYDPVTDTWTQKANMGASTTDANCFVIGTSAYILGGCAAGYSDANWEYNTITNAWSQKADLPSDPRCDAASFTICDLGYWGIGEVGGTILYVSDLWQYNPVTNTWLQKANFPGLLRDEPAYFSIGSKGYLGLGGEDTSPVYDDFWEYTPDSACATGIEELQVSGLQFEVSPNPASQFTIVSWQSSENKKIEITITDTNGKKVYETQLETNTSNLKLQTSNFPDGIYFVELNNGKEKTVKKFVKK